MLRKMENVDKLLARKDMKSALKENASLNAHKTNIIWVENAVVN